MREHEPQVLEPNSTHTLGMDRCCCPCSLRIKGARPIGGVLVRSLRSISRGGRNLSGEPIELGGHHVFAKFTLLVSTDAKALIFSFAEDRHIHEENYIVVRRLAGQRAKAR